MIPYVSAVVLLIYYSATKMVIVNLVMASLKLFITIDVQFELENMLHALFMEGYSTKDTDLVDFLRNSVLWYMIWQWVVTYLMHEEFWR